MFILFSCIFLSIFCLSKQDNISHSKLNRVKYSPKYFNINYNFDNKNLVYKTRKFGRVVQLDDDFGDISRRTDIKSGFILYGLVRSIEFKTAVDSENVSLPKISAPSESDQGINHRVNLDTGRMELYGRSHSSNQYWPVEKPQFKNYSYVERREDGACSAERYRLN